MTNRDYFVPKLAWVILGLVFLRMFCSIFLGNRWELFAQPEVAAYLLNENENTPQLTDPISTAPVAPLVSTTEPENQPPSSVIQPVVPEREYAFSEADVAFVELTDTANRNPDTEALLTQPLQWDLTSDEPSVLIFHTHGTEAFTSGDGYFYEEEGGEYRTTDEDCNMLALGEELARLLNAAGIRTVQDRSYYDYPDYTASYDTARVGLQEQLKKYPTVKLVIDLHRDSAELEDGTQWATKATVNGEPSAQIMLVLGTDRYYTHPNYEQNLSIALKLHAIMEKTHEGVTRPLDLRRQRFNQDLSTGAIIAEIGAAGNTYQEAMTGVSVLAEAIILLAKGTN